MRHIPFSLFGPNIFLKIFLSNTNSLLIMVSFNIHVSHEYVTTGHCFTTAAVFASATYKMQPQACHNTWLLSYCSLTHSLTHSLSQGTCAWIFQELNCHTLHAGCCLNNFTTGIQMAREMLAVLHLSV